MKDYFSGSCTEQGDAQRKSKILVGDPPGYDLGHINFLLSCMLQFLIVATFPLALPIFLVKGNALTKPPHQLATEMWLSQLCLMVAWLNEEEKGLPCLSSENGGLPIHYKLRGPFSDTIVLCNTWKVIKRKSQSALFYSVFYIKYIFKLQDGSFRLSIWEEGSLFQHKSLNQRETFKKRQPSTGNAVCFYEDRVKGRYCLLQFYNSASH